MTADKIIPMSQHPKGGAVNGEINPDFHGAAVIDEEGNEIPITEEMVQDAFEELEELEEQTSEDTDKD